MPWLPLRLRWSSPASGGPSGCGPPLLTVFLALAAVVGHSSGSSAAGPAGPAGGVVPGGGPAGPAGAVVPPPHGNSTAAAAAAATTAPRAAVKDLGFGPSGYGRGGFESVLAAVFNKVAKGTTATPMTTRPPPAAPTTTAVPTTTRPPATTARPATVPPPPTETVPLRPPPPPPPMEGLGVVGGVPPTRRAPHPLPDYAPPNRPPPLPAEYNPFANKAILRGSQSEIGSATPGRKSHPQHLPRPSMDELIPLRPVNTPSQGSSGKDAAPALPEPPRPERPPERAGAAGKHHLDSHIHTVASAPAAVPALTPIGHHQGGHGGGHHGHHGNGHGTDHSLKAAKPTELLEQVNKDSIIQQGLEIQSEVAIVADPAIHRDEDNRDKVLVDTSPPSSVVRQGAGPGGEPSGGPVAGAAGGEWHLAWTAQVYGLGTMWGVLAVLCLLAAIVVDSRTRLVPRVHFTMLLALLLALAAANAASLFYDVLYHDQLQQQHHRGREDGPPPPPQPPAAASVGVTRVPQMLADLALPFLPAAFSVFFFVVLRVNHIPCGSSGVPQTPVFLVLLFLFLATTMSLEVASCAVAGASGGGSAWGGAGVGGGCGGGGMRSAARGLSAAVAALLGLSYTAVFRPLRRAAAKKQAEQMRAAYTAFRRLPAPALPRVVNALLACALLLMALAAMAAYRVMEATVLGSSADWRLPPWWYLRLAEHAGSLLVGFLLLWCATRGPSRGSDERSNSSRSSRGTPGALSLVSCTGRRFLFDCPSTGSEENKTSEDNTYPAVCASNHAILNYTQHTGNKLYDDSFPLANLHPAQALPLNSSGDDFGSVPPKRAARGHGANGGVAKAGTLGPYSKASRRAAAPGPGHHTLGPGGQLYDGAERDTLRRGSRTTGRTRKARRQAHHQDSSAHGAHQVYSNCPQDDEYDFEQPVDLDGMADEFTVFKQYASTGSSESADNYDVPMLVSAASGPAGPAEAKRHRRRERADAHHRGRHNGVPPASNGPADSLSPASPSDFSDCDRLSSNRSSYDEGAPMAVRGHANHHGGHYRGKKHQHLYDASEDDVTPDSAVVADITASPRVGSGTLGDRRAGKRLGRRHQQHQHVSQESPSSPELHDNVWSPQ